MYPEDILGNVRLDGKNYVVLEILSTTVLGIYYDSQKYYIINSLIYQHFCMCGAHVTLLCVLLCVRVLVPGCSMGLG